MKFLTPDEVNQRIEAYNQLLGREKSLQEELLSLQIYGNREHVALAKKRHEAIIQEIQDIRMKEMLPIIRDCCEFIAGWEKYKQEHGIQTEDDE